MMNKFKVSLWRLITETHYELAMKAMEAGKGVFVEKPMALNISDAESMQAQARKSGRILMVGHLLEYHPAVLKLKELIVSGELGKINYVYSNRLNFGKVRTEENALWSFAPHERGGNPSFVGTISQSSFCERRILSKQGYC